MSTTKVTDSLRNVTVVDAAKITTGTIPEARITSLDSTKLTGTVDIARLPSTAVNSNVDLTTLSASNLTSGTVATARLGSGTASSSTFLRGDSTYAAAGGGKVLQVVSVTKTDTFNSTATGFTDITGLTLAITCAATSSKVLVLWHVNTGSPAGYNAGLQLSRAGSPIGGGGASSSRPTGQFHHLTPTAATELNSAGSFLDSPSSTSALTYKFQVNYEGGSSGVWINRSTGHSNHATYVMSASTITLIEIGA